MVRLPRANVPTPRCEWRDDSAVSEHSYGPFERPVTINNWEWSLLEAVRGRTVTEVANDLGIPERRVRLLLANLGQKLAIASKL